MTHPTKQITIVFDTFPNKETGAQRFKIKDNGGELETSYFDNLEDAIKDIDNRTEHYTKYAKQTVEKRNIRVR